MRLPTRVLLRTAASRALSTDASLFLLVVAAAFSLRALYLLQARAVPGVDLLVVDARWYWEWAGRIAGGQWSEERAFYQAPLYPYVLAALRAVSGDSIFAVRCLQAALGALACGVLFLTGRELRSSGVGLAAGLALAAYPPAIFLEAQIQKGALTLFLTSALLLALARYETRPGARRQALVGLALGLLMLTREESRLFLPLWAALCWHRGRGGRGRRSRELLALLLGVVLPLAPAALHNWTRERVLAPSTTQAGPNLWIGNHPGARGWYVPLREGRQEPRHEREDAERLAEAAVGRDLDAGEVSRFWMARTARGVIEDPWGWVALLGRKALLAVHRRELPDAESQAFHEQYVPMLRGLAGLWHLGVLLPLGVGGLLLARFEGRRWGGIELFVASQLLALVAFYVFARYRLPLVPVLALGAGWLLARAPGALRERPRALGLAALAGALAALPANWPLFPRRHELALAHGNVAAALLEAGDHRGFLEHTQAAVDLGSQVALSNLAIALARAGRPELAAEQLRAALSFTPEDPRLWKRLGIALGEAGRWAEAVEAFERSLALFPNDDEARSNLAFALAQVPSAGTVPVESSAPSPGDEDAAEDGR